MDLIRKILIGVEDRDLSSLESEYSSEQIDYHMHLLEQANYIEYSLKTKDRSILKGLTWQGHDLIDKIRNETFWNKFKADMKEKSIPVTLDLILPLIKDFIKRQLSISE
ncbi:DUF2513 domain-containing protein [Bacillus atrophaeus]|uniref:DUF2513 domain-containing protein n=1 Tax=Bacillus atrophaeus TaxID=1452 RepID=UPI00227E6BA1|nr:DUF2513 domain-containing protein [Bacillus atrophaeus]MCY8988106.1 DUF2513 domain-containing protein [Bacillus atrophaeus]